MVLVYLRERQAGGCRQVERLVVGAAAPSSPACQQNNKHRPLDVCCILAVKASAASSYSARVAWAYSSVVSCTAPQSTQDHCSTRVHLHRRAAEYRARRAAREGARGAVHFATPRAPGQRTCPANACLPQAAAACSLSGRGSRQPAHSCLQHNLLCSKSKREPHACCPPALACVTPSHRRGPGLPAPRPAAAPCARHAISAAMSSDARMARLKLKRLRPAPG